MKDILNLTRMTDVIELLVERRVSRLAYEGISGIESYFHDRLGVTMFSNENERQLARELIELRNIIVHNGGVVNGIFLERIGKNPTKDFQEGQRFHVGWAEFCEYAANIISVSLRLDAVVCAKFSIRRKRFGTWIDASKS